MLWPKRKSRKRHSKRPPKHIKLEPVGNTVKLQKNLDRSFAQHLSEALMEAATLKKPT